MISLPGPVDLAQLVTAVTSPMLGLTFRPDKEDRPWADLVWRAAVLNIPGAFPLSVGLSSDRAGCEKLCAAMFQAPHEEVTDEMMSDALRELVNMTAGLLKSHLKLDQALGLPRITPSGKPPVPQPPPEADAVVLKADKLGLVLWVFLGIC